MANPEQQAATQLANIEAATGLTPAAVAELVREAGIDKHGQIMTLLKTEYGLTHGNANLLATLARERLAGGPASNGDLLAAQYAKGKAALRPILDEIVAMAQGLGDDVEVVIQKTAVSLRRRKQFAVVRAASASRVELGLNLPETPPDERIQPTTGMCNHRVDVPDLDAVDDAVATWLSQAYEHAG